METFKILVVLHAVVFCQAKLYVNQTFRTCTWTVTSAGENQSVAAFTNQFLSKLAAQVCKDLGCGGVYTLKESTAHGNASCLSNCIYHNNELINCTTTDEENCITVSDVVCGNHALRLTGGSHHCAGRVELWQVGGWGTVCDDEWDIQDGNVVCAQLGCGYAVAVTGQEGPYSQGKGPIIMDELNCTGKEQSLWECPAVRENHDCGHKEDAGVMCSEHKALRLTGGLDHCSGRVEIHRNGTWGTVCDSCWEKEEASMACAMLGCGGFKKLKTFTHKNGTLYFYQCKKNHTNLWDCAEYYGTTLPICRETKAAGVICDNSLGLPALTTLEPFMTNVTTQLMTEAPAMVWSLELLGCILLSCVLLIAIMVNIILCCYTKKRRVHTVQQQYNNLQTITQAQENHYRDSVDFIKITSNDTNPNELELVPTVQIMAPRMWPQSSVESASYDTDHEQNENSQDSSFPLSTFRNSMRYSEDGRLPAMNSTHLQNVIEEDTGVHQDTTMQRLQHHNYTPSGAVQSVTASPSVDSFETSSTSSEECYENSVLINADLDLDNYENTGENINNLQNENTNMEQGDEDDFPIYSPVSIEAKSDISGDSDYDDIANYSQTKLP